MMMVLMVSPRQRSHSKAMASESGMAVRLISVVRQSPRNRARITTTSRHPSHSASVR